MSASSLYNGEASAFWFADEGTPLLGWYHPPALPMRTCGVLLCPPFAHEYMVSYRAYIQLAKKLAAAGFPVVFFDYANTGDSGDTGQISLKDWQQDILRAQEQLRRLSGLQQISLFGMRLGALLAACVADLQEVAALIMVAPVVSGRSYVRELQIFRNMSPIPASDNPAQTVSAEELTGYDFSASLQHEIAQLDMSKLKAKPAQRCLIFSKDDASPVEKKLAESLQAREVQVEARAATGYPALMTDDAYNSVVPAQMWDDIVSWLQTQFAPCANSPDAAPLLEKNCSLVHAGVLIQEQIMLADGLSGVVSMPATPRHPNARPAVILTNVGANHRVGNHRLYVSLARTIASRGFTVVRFDRAGFGYSRPTRKGREHEVYDAEGAADVQAVMDYLQAQLGSQRFILAGLCSGAYFSYHAALDNPRVAGLILMNQLTFQWHDGDSLEVKKQETYKSTAFYLQTVVSAQTWKRVFSGDIDVLGISRTLSKRLAGRVATATLRLLNRVSGSEHLLSEVAQHFLKMKKNGVDLFFVFADDDSSIDLMIGHLGNRAQLLGDYPRLRIEVIPAADHTFTPKWAQAHLCETLAGHLSQRFPE